MNGDSFQGLEVLNWLRTTFHKHDWKSGEIILEVEAVAVNNPYKAESEITNFLMRKGIRHNAFRDTFVLQDRAAILQSIQYGLSTKVNYTSVAIEFTKPLSEKLACRFIGLFAKDCKYYTLPEANETFYRSKCPDGEFVERGGGIVVDHGQIGILWITDFY